MSRVFASARPALLAGSSVLCLSAKPLPQPFASALATRSTPRLCAAQVLAHGFPSLRRTTTRSLSASRAQEPNKRCAGGGHVTRMTGSSAAPACAPSLRTHPQPAASPVGGVGAGLGFAATLTTPLAMLSGVPRCAMAGERCAAPPSRLRSSCWCKPMRRAWSGQGV